MEQMRLDKWLWAARFFKTRQLAAEAITGGKVQLNGQRTKPGKDIRAGSQLRIHKGSLEWEIEVKILAKQRRPASEAVTFYEEREESRHKRQELVIMQREQRAAMPHSHARPNKRERRILQRLRQRLE